MRKTLKFQLLSSIFFISTFESCSPKEEKNSKIVSSNNKQDALKNMLTFLNDNLENKNYDNLCSLKFANFFIENLAIRSESEKNKRCVDEKSKRLFASKDFNVVDYLQEISKKINEEQSTASVVVMGNTDNKSFESLKFK